MNVKIGDVVGVFDKTKAKIESTAWNEVNWYKGEMAVLGAPMESDSLQYQQYQQSINFYDRYQWRYFLTLNFVRFVDYDFSFSKAISTSRTIKKQTHNTLYGPNEVRLIHNIREQSFQKRRRRRRTVVSIDEDIEFVIRRFLEYFFGKWWAKMQDEWLTILVVREGSRDDKHFHLLIANHEKINGLDHMASAMMWVSKHSRCLKQIFPHEKDRLLERQEDTEARIDRIRNYSNTGRRIMDEKDFSLNLQEIKPTEEDRAYVLGYLMKENRQHEFSNHCLLVPGGPYFPIVTSAWDRIPRQINPNHQMN